MRRMAVVLVLAALAAPAAAQPKPKPFTLDHFAIGWENCYRPMEWTPVELTFGYRLEKPMGATVRLAAQQDDQTHMTVSVPVGLTPDMPIHLPIVTKLVYGGREASIELRDEKGGLRLREEFDMVGPARAVTALTPEDVLIGVVGRPGFGLLHLATQTHLQEREGGNVYVKLKLPRQLPVDWTGYASLDLLVLYDADFSSVSPHAAAAIAEYVENGGRCLIVLNANPLPANNPVAKLVPFRTAEPVERPVADSVLSSWGLTPAGVPANKRTLVWHAPPEELPPMWQAVSLEASRGPEASWPMLVHGPVGFGRVGVLLADPSRLGGQHGEAQAGFWLRATAPVAARPLTPGAPSRQPNVNPYGDSYQYGAATSATNAVMDHLYSIPELRPVSIWVVIALLAGLAILIGPVDYIVLKKLDRLPLTWVTSAGWVVIFTVGAYYGVQALRGGTTHVRVVTVADGIAGGVARGTTYAGIFASSSDNYPVQCDNARSWWSSICPMQMQRMMYSENRGARSIACRQCDGGNLLTDVPVNIWTLQGLLGEMPLDNLPLSAEVREIRAGEYSVKLTNRADYDIQASGLRLGGPSGGWVAMGGLGPVPAGETASFRARIESGRGRDELAPLAYAGLPEGATCAQACQAYGTAQRSKGVQQYLAQEGMAVVYAFSRTAPPGLKLREHKGVYNHVQVMRLVVKVAT